MLYVDEKRCSGCSLCLDVCAAGAITLQDDVATIDQKLCTECEACAAECPKGAILTVTEAALVPQPERQVAPHELQQVTVPVVAKLAPAIGSALFFVGREIVPRIATYLLDTFDRRISSLPATGDNQDQAMPSTGETGGGGHRSRRRRRGRS